MSEIAKSWLDSCHRLATLAHQNLPIPLSAFANALLLSDAPHVDDAAVSRTDRDLEAAVSAPGAVDEVTSTAVHAAYVTEATIAQQAFAL